MSGDPGFIFWGPFAAFAVILAGYGLWIWWSER